MMGPLLGKDRHGESSGWAAYSSIFNMNPKKACPLETTEWPASCGSTGGVAEMRNYRIKKGKRKA